MGAYGDSPAPRIDADEPGHLVPRIMAARWTARHVYRGYVSSAVLLYDAAYVTVRAGLKITNHSGAVLGELLPSPTRMERTGVAVVAKDKVHAAALRCAISPSTM